MILGGNTRFHEIVLSALKQKYPFKHWRLHEGEFLGRKLKQKPDMSIVCDQKEYASKVESINISRERRKQRAEPLTSTELRGSDVAGEQYQTRHSSADGSTPTEDGFGDRAGAHGRQQAGGQDTGSLTPPGDLQANPHGPDHVHCHIRCQLEQQ